MTIPPIAVESAKEAAHRLLELCMSDAPPLDKDLVRTHALDVIEALTDDEESHPCGHVDVDPEPRLLEDVTILDLSIGPGPNAWGYTVEVTP